MMRSHGYAYEVLRLSEVSKKNRPKRIHKTINSNIKSYSSGRTTQPPHKSTIITSPEGNLVKRINAKMRNGDISGCICVLCSDEPVVASCPESLQLTKDKHSVDIKAVLLPLPPNMLNVPAATAAEVNEAICSFQPGASVGLAGFPPQHLRDVVAKSSDMNVVKVCESLAALMTTVLRGKVRSHVLNILWSNPNSA